MSKSKKGRWIVSVAMAWVTITALACDNRTQKPLNEPTHVPTASEPVFPTPVEEEPTMPAPNIKQIKDIKDVGADWVAGSTQGPWYSVGYSQKLWKWENLKPTEVAHGIYIRDHFGATLDNEVLTVDARKFSLSEEAPGFAGSFEKLLTDFKQGYEGTEVMWTPDLGTLVASMNFRAPRGQRIRHKDGTKGYKYSRPTSPDGPSSFVTIIDAATGEQLYQRDGTGHSLAHSTRHIGFLAGSKLVLVDRKTWKAHEFDAPGPVHFLALNDQFLVLVGYGKEAFSYRLSDTGEPEELLRWPVQDNARFISIHPTNRLVSVGYTKPTSVQIWDPSTSIQKPVKVIEDAMRAHFLPDGKHLIVANADRDAAGVRVFSLY